MATEDEQLNIAADYLRAGQLGHAEQAYRKILRANPRHPGALHQLGIVSNLAGRHDLAINLLTQAIMIRPADPTFHNSLGDVYRATGSTSQARACYEQALRFAPSFPLAHYNLGLLSAADRPDDARHHFVRAIELLPQYTPAHIHLGNVLRQQGKLDEAAASYRKAVALQPHNTQALSSLGAVLTELGRVDEAKEVLHEVGGIRDRNISHKHECIFIHIPRTAGTSIKKVLALPGGGHPPWRFYATNHAELWKKYTSFAVVRNPWDRVASAYHHARMKHSHWHDDQALPHPDFHLLADKSFEECLTILRDERARLTHESWAEQSRWIIDTDSPEHPVMVDTVLRYETLADDFAKLCSRLRVDSDALPALNRSKRSQDYRSYYTEQTRKIVEQIYAVDIRTFGYSF